MKVCLLTGTYHPKVGGAETYANIIATGMQKRGHEIIIVTDGVGYKEDLEEKADKVRVLRTIQYDKLLADPSKVRWEQMYFSLLTELNDMIGKEEINLVHANSLDTAILGSIVATTLGIPLICTFHEQEPELEPFGYGKCHVIFSKLPVDHFIAGSHFYYDKAIANGVRRDRIKLIHHGIDLTVFQSNKGRESRFKYGVTDSELLVVCAARLKERKGLLELVRALKLAKEQVPNIRAVIAGSCNSASRMYADQLHKEIQELDLTGIVQIDESLTLSDMPVFYSAADLVVQPSHAEGLGLAVLEGLASRKAVVASAIPGIQEIITDGEDGLLVPPKEVLPLADAIIRILRDDSLRNKLAEAGQKMVFERFNIERMITDTEDLYQQLVGGKHGE